MKASIAMAVFNGEKYIKKQIESILAQTFTDFELIISDDNSTDCSMKICREFQMKDKRIKIIKNSGNRGFVSNFFNALSYCKGDLLFLADQDDIWIHTKLEKIIKIQKKTGAGLVIHNLYEFSDKTGLPDCSSFSDNPLVKQINFYTVFSQCSYPGLEMCFTKQLNSNILILYKKLCKNKIEIPSHDWLISLYASLNSTVFHTDEILIFHRMHENNVTAKLRMEITKDERLYKIEILQKHFFFAKSLLNNTQCPQKLYVRNYIKLFRLREKILASNYNTFLLFFYLFYENFIIILIHNNKSTNKARIIDDVKLCLPPYVVNNIKSIKHTVKSIIK
jgi:glycosyltransferase involved in cell wall biosynthesis